MPTPLQSCWFQATACLLCAGLLGSGIPAWAQTDPLVPSPNPVFNDGNFNFNDLMQLTNQLQNRGPSSLNGESAVDDAVQEFRSRRGPVQIRSVRAEDEGSPAEEASTEDQELEDQETQGPPDLTDPDSF